MIISDAYYVTKAYVVGDVPLFLWGHKGIGKSTLVADIGRELNMPVIDLRLATQEVSDLIGIPSKEYKISCPKCKATSVRKTGNLLLCNKCKYSDDETAFNTTAQTIWAAPEWFPGEDQPEGILFLDEMNRAQRDVRQAVFQLVLDRKLHTHILPKGWRIIAAGNYFGAYDVAEMDEAMMSRFGHIDIETTHHAVCSFGIEHNWVSRITDFLRANPKFVEMTPEDQGEKHETYNATPDPRRWSMVDRLIKASMGVFPQNDRGEHLIRIMLTGLVGEAAARAFMSHSGSLPTFEDVLTGKITFGDIAKKFKSSESKLNDAVQKVFMEMTPLLKARPFKDEKGNTTKAEKEFENIIAFILEADRRDLTVSVLQEIIELSQSHRLKADEWRLNLTNEKRLHKFLIDLIKAKNINLEV